MESTDKVKKGKWGIPIEVLQEFEKRKGREPNRELEALCFWQLIETERQVGNQK